MGEDAVIGAARCAWGVLLTHGKFCEEAGPAGPKSEIQISPSKLFDPKPVHCPGICALQNCEDLKRKWIANSKQNRKFSIFVLKKKKTGAVKC